MEIRCRPQPVYGTCMEYYSRIKNYVNAVRNLVSSCNSARSVINLIHQIMLLVVVMSKKTNQKSVLPIYALGLVWLCYSLFFGLSGLGDFIKCGILSWAVYKLVQAITRQQKQEKPQTQPEVSEEPQPSQAKAEPQPQKPQTTGNAELDAVVQQGREAVKRIQELNDDIPDYKISAQLKQIEILTASIIDQVEKKEDKLKQIRQFMNYYLPTTIKLLEQYVLLQDVGLKGENITAGMQQIEDLLDKVIVAFQKELDSMFERDVVDITADIQVMEQMMAAQGLTDRKDF